MGTVYLARDLALDRPVALKVLLPEFAEQAGLRERFLRETRTAAGFSHPNIVPVYAVEEAEGHLAYAMGFVEGETLTQRVERAGPLTVRELVRVVQDVGYALAYAHGRGVVHRDIKPDNVMLERATGRALVMDFGISRSMTQAAPGSTRNLTRVGEVIGTPEYMSPEQASGDVVDGRSDIYSLGLTAWYAATGRTAVSGDTTQQILVRQLTERVPSVEQSRPDLPPALAAAIDRCLEKEPAARFPTAEALVDELDAAQLAAPEIPLPERLFAGELSSLSLAAIVLLWLGLFMVDRQVASNMSSFDVLLPVVGVLAILVTRAMTTMAEGQRIAKAGFTPDDVIAGLGRVVEEGRERRDELRADPDVRRRRRSTLIWAVAMLVVAVAMLWASLEMRVKLGPRRYDVSPLGAALFFSGVSLLGTSWVLLVRSPFRMPPGERFFRAFWLGPIGRGFVRLSMRGARTTAAPARGTTRPAPVLVPAPAPTKRTTPPATPDRLADLEKRVGELERWRNSADD
jgi:hypothetical protein